MPPDDVRALSAVLRRPVDGFDRRIICDNAERFSVDAFRACLAETVAEILKGAT